MNEEIRTLIAEADRAIREERFDDLMDFYTDDAVLVISPGRLAQGKAAIRTNAARMAALPCASRPGLMTSTASSV